jgi:hypothetical protein
MPYTVYEAFFDLLRGLDGYIDELSPYQMNGSQTILPKLPTELRTKVYDNLLPAKDHPINCIVVKDIQNTPYYGIFHINESTRIDISLYYVSTRLLDVDTDRCRATIIKLLETMPGEQGFFAVRRVKFYYFSHQVPVPGGSMNDNMDLLGRCRGIRYLSLNWDTRQMMRAWNVDRAPRDNWYAAEATDYALFSEDEIICLYQLYRIVELQTVDTIVMTIHMWGNNLHPEVEGYFWDAVALVRDIGPWMEEEFEKRGRKVEVKKYSVRGASRHTDRARVCTIISK